MPNQTASREPSMEEATLNLCEVTSALAAKSAQMYQAEELRKQAVAAALPATVSAVVAAGLVEASDKHELTRALADPVTALQALKLAADRLQSQQASLPASLVDKLGRPVHANGNGNGVKLASDQRQDEFLARRDAAWDQHMRGN